LADEIGELLARERGPGRIYIFTGLEQRGSSMIRESGQKDHFRFDPRRCIVTARDFRFTVGSAHAGAFDHRQIAAGFGKCTGKRCAASRASSAMTKFRDISGHLIDMTALCR
jgi:hypothetical protein